MTQQTYERSHATRRGFKSYSTLWYIGRRYLTSPQRKYVASPGISSEVQASVHELSMRESESSPYHAEASLELSRGGGGYKVHLAPSTGGLTISPPSA